MTTEITTEIIKRTGPTVRIKFGPGYATSVIGRTMAKVTNTGNGYIAGAEPREASASGNLLYDTRKNT